MTVESLCALVADLARRSGDRALAIAAAELVARARGLATIADDLIAQAELRDAEVEVERVAPADAPAALAETAPAIPESDPVRRPSNLVDETGNRYGRWLVIGRAASAAGGDGKPGARFVIRCDCGAERVVLGWRLRSGQAFACASCSPAPSPPPKRGGTRKLIDETGKRYGMLAVIERAPSDPDNPAARWRCRCDCGNEIVAIGSNLRAGNSKTCGKHRRGMMPMVAESAAQSSDAPIGDAVAPTGDAAIGWQSIAALAHRTEAWCQFMATPANSLIPLPVRRDADGVVWMSRAEYEAWRRKMGSSQHGAAGEIGADAEA